MCQLKPFTYPCCEHLYVMITKLPSCPDDWPRRKCPEDLCIQIGGLEPFRESFGTCWRCLGLAAGLNGAETEALRPPIDGVPTVHGLEELDTTRRKTRCENSGNCWYCGARGGCPTCGTSEFQPSTYTPKSNNTPRKRVRNGLGPETRAGAKKKAKTEKAKEEFEYGTPGPNLPFAQHPGKTMAYGRPNPSSTLTREGSLTMAYANMQHPPRRPVSRRADGGHSYAEGSNSAMTYAQQNQYPSMTHQPDTRAIDFAPQSQTPQQNVQVSNHRSQPTAHYNNAPNLFDHNSLLNSAFDPALLQPSTSPEPTMGTGPPNHNQSSTFQQPSTPVPTQFQSTEPSASIGPSNTENAHNFEPMKFEDPELDDDAIAGALRNWDSQSHFEDTAANGAEFFGDLSRFFDTV